MKITQVRAHVLRSALEQPFSFSQGWVSTRGATLVEVQTDDGITGWGEALCQGLQPPEIAAAAINHALKHLVMGEDPLQPEVLWHRMYHYTRDYGQKGAVVGAISGDRHRALGHLRQGAQRIGGEAARRHVPHQGRGIRNGLLSHQRPRRGAAPGEGVRDALRQRFWGSEDQAWLRHRGRFAGNETALRDIGKTIAR